MHIVLLSEYSSAYTQLGDVCTLQIIANTGTTKPPTQTGLPGYGIALIVIAMILILFTIVVILVVVIRLVRRRSIKNS